MLRIAWIAVCCVLAGLGAAWLARAPGERGPAAAGLAGPSLGAGSAVALPFGQARFAAPDAAEAASAWWQGLPARSGVPRAVALLGEEPVRDALDRLGSLARRGDPQAAYDAYQIAQFCADSGDFDRTLVALPVETDQGLRGQMQAQAAQHARLCEGATPAQLGERLADIRIAADGGVPGAAERLLDAALPGPAPGDAGDAASGELRQHAFELVHRDALGGDASALTALASLYQSGQIVAQDPTQALLFQSAALEIMKSQGQTYSSGEIELEQQFVSGTEALVPSEDRDAIRQAALDLAVRCCRTASR